MHAVIPDFKIGRLQDSMAVERRSQLQVNIVAEACECRALLLWDSYHMITIMKASIIQPMMAKDIDAAQHDAV